MSSPAPRFPVSFVRLAWSNLAAQSAEQVALAAAPLVAVLALGAGAAETGLLQTALTLPFLLLAIPAGVLADRLSRRGLMVAAEALRALALLAILALILGGHVTWPLLAALGFLAACGTVVYSVAAPALVPALVPADRLAPANARLELARTLAFTAGPALGGVLVGWTGAGAAFAVAAGLSLAATGLLAGLHEPARAARPRRHVLQEIAEGARFVAGHALLRPVLITQFVFNTAYFVIMAVFVPFAVRHLAMTASGVGLVLALYGAGMVAGALLAPAVMRRLAFGTVVAIGPVTGLAASLVMAATIWVPTPVLAGLGFFLLGLGPILWVISTTTLRQAVTPPGLLGRVSSFSVLAQGSRPLGAALGAAVAAMSGAEACLLLAVVGFLLQALVILASPAVRLARQPEMATATT
ncbi:MFS transporter [Thalassobaculum fulvum]|uniref:MFS transporter n=1 Tax=Thalassobaculum fulvum TaxID=1633335 RepID=A0A918XT15_9PROT|nr:MFS transporter [Thalassobaculum fulvum]GHD51722.1 MFS transporter [Thalassobaculum fulvum]